jgi:citrate lyase subunit beta/citryl-CoA lyase
MYARSSHLSFRPRKSSPHPTQVEPINAAFSPTAAEIVFATRVVEAFDQAEAEGVAAIQLDGQFIDYPIVAAAHTCWQLLRRSHSDRT